MVLEKIPKKRRLPRGQHTLSRFLFRAAYKRLGHNILRLAEWPGSVLSKYSYWSLAMDLKRYKRMTEYWKKTHKTRQKRLTEYWRAAHENCQQEQ